MSNGNDGATNMTAAEFVAKWSKAELTEQSAAQQHFLDLCELVEHPKPAEADPTGDSFAFAIRE